MTSRKAARNMWSRNTNKIGIQCVCWFYWPGICHDARSYDPKKKSNYLCQFADTLQSLFEVTVMRVTQVSALQFVRPSVCVPYLNGIYYICRLNISFLSHTRITSLDSTFSVILHALLLLKRGESRLWSSHRDTFFCCDLRYSCHLRNSAQIFKSLLEYG